MVKIRVPATSANLGPGFDCLGVALTHYNELTVQIADRVRVEAYGAGADLLPKNENNLTYRSMQAVYNRAGQQMPPVHMVQHNALPLSRGLGSSAAAIVGGVVAANELLGRPFTPMQLLEEATALEGHPDNVAPCLLGGLTASMMAGQQVFTQRAQVSEQWRFAAMIPNFTLSTSKARAALPAQYAKADAVANVSRAVLMYAALQNGDAAMLRAASADLLHQPYRSPLIKEWDEVNAAAQACGTAAVFLSGAGPTVMCVYNAQDEAFPQRLAQAVAPLSGAWQILSLQCDDMGACVVE